MGTVSRMQCSITLKRGTRRRTLIWPTRHLAVGCLRNPNWTRTILFSRPKCNDGVRCMEDFMTDVVFNTKMSGYCASHEAQCESFSVISMREKLIKKTHLTAIFLFY